MGTVADLRGAIGRPPRPIPTAPAAFDGSRSAYIARVLEPMLPGADVVEAFHRSLVAYLANPEAVLLIRAVPRVERGTTPQTADGSRIRWTDNAPAWWWHALLFNGLLPDPDRLARLLADTPCEWKAVVGRGTLNDAGWHAAHLLDVKDGDTDWRSWSRRSAVRRFVRNVHPCNVFYVPLADWQRVGADRALIASVAARYRGRYAAIWSEFIELAAGDPTLGDDARDGHLAIDGQAQRALPPRERPTRSTALADAWVEILEVRHPPPIGELLASHPHAEAYTRELLAGLTVERLIATADTLYNRCRPSDLRAEAPGDPRHQAEIGWRRLLNGVEKVHRHPSGWTGAAALLRPGATDGLAAIATLDIAALAGVCMRLVRGPYSRAVPRR